LEEEDWSNDTSPSDEEVCYGEVEDAFDEREFEEGA